MYFAEELITSFKCFDTFTGINSKNKIGVALFSLKIKIFLVCIGEISNWNILSSFGAFSVLYEILNKGIRNEEKWKSTEEFLLINFRGILLFIFLWLYTMVQCKRLIQYLLLCVRFIISKCYKTKVHLFGNGISMEVRVQKSCNTNLAQKKF